MHVVVCNIFLNFNKDDKNLIKNKKNSKFFLNFSKKKIKKWVLVGRELICFQIISFLLGFEDSEKEITTKIPPSPSASQTFTNDGHVSNTESATSKTL